MGFLVSLTRTTKRKEECIRAFSISVYEFTSRSEPMYDPHICQRVSLRDDLLPGILKALEDPQAPQNVVASFISAMEKRRPSTFHSFSSTLLNFQLLRLGSQSNTKTVDYDAECALWGLQEVVGQGPTRDHRTCESTEELGRVLSKCGFASFIPESCGMSFVLPQTSPQTLARLRKRLFSYVTGVKSFSIYQEPPSEGSLITFIVSSRSFIQFVRELSSLECIADLVELDDLAALQVLDLPPLQLRPLFGLKGRLQSSATLLVRILFLTVATS